MNQQRRNILGLLEQVRAIAQTGLHFTKDPYDQDRYRQLLDLAVEEYAALGEVDEKDVREALLKELNGISPKVAASAAIFSDDGHILLIKRSDNQRWTHPGGLCEVAESAKETAAREAHEETGLFVEAGDLIDVFCVKAGMYNKVHTMYTIMYHCVVTGGQMTPTMEAVDVGFFDHRSIPEAEWQYDIQRRVERAYEFWCMNLRTAKS